MASTELFDSGPARPPRRRLQPRPRGGVAVVVLVAAAELVALVLSGTPREEVPSAVTFVENWIDAFNARDARTVSAMTCDYVAAFKSVRSIGSLLADVPGRLPVVSTSSVTGIRSITVDGRSGVQVDLADAGGGEGKARIFVRVRDPRDMCIESFAAW